MTIKKISEILADVLPYTVSDEDIKGWLSDLDGQIMNEIILTHENAQIKSFAPYTDADETLLVPEPYARDVYINFLSAKAAGACDETARYNNSILLFEGAYTAFYNYYNSTHRPKSRGAFVY